MFGERKAAGCRGSPSPRSRCGTRSAGSLAIALRAPGARALGELLQLLAGELLVDGAGQLRLAEVAGLDDDISHDFSSPSQRRGLHPLLLLHCAPQEHEPSASCCSYSSVSSRSMESFRRTS